VSMNRTPRSPVRSPSPSGIGVNATKFAELAVFRGAWQKMRELSPLVSLLRRRRLRGIVEIGTLQGGTMWLWCRLATDDAILVSVDLPGGEFEGGYPARHVALLRSYASDGQSLHCLRRDSHLPSTVQRVRGALTGRSVDLLFLDGDHRYGGVLQDFESYAPLVRDGGLVVCHDILRHPNACGGRVSSICSSQHASRWICAIRPP
jgi:predicted O-methyltransferase YrrM